MRFLVLIKMAVSHRNCQHHKDSCFGLCFKNIWVDTLSILFPNFMLVHTPYFLSLPRQKHYIEQKNLYCKGDRLLLSRFFLLEARLMTRKIQEIAFSVFVSCFFLAMHFRPIVAVLFVNFSTTVCRHLPVFNCTIQMSSGLFRIWVSICYVHCLKNSQECFCLEFLNLIIHSPKFFEQLQSL